MSTIRLLGAGRRFWPECTLFYHRSWWFWRRAQLHPENLNLLHLHRNERDELRGVVEDVVRACDEAARVQR